MSAIFSFFTARSGVAALVGLFATILSALGMGGVIADQGAFVDAILLIVQGVSYIVAAVLPSAKK